MNDRPRVLLITRHFWPHGSIDSACYAYQLSTALKRDGVDVSVVTPRHASSWTDRLTVAEVPVYRPATAPRSDWALGRYTRHLSAWLREHAGAFDVLLVDGIREEATAAVEAARTLGCATILRCAGWGPHHDTQQWKRNRWTARCASLGKLADAVVAASAESARSLIAGGYLPERVIRIDDGIAAGMARPSGLRQSARKSLASANGDLFAEADAPVVLCMSPMTRESGIQLLVEAARPLIMRYPLLRLWFIGDGPYRDWIYQQLRGEGVRASIAMPGSFCDGEELFQAADVYLQPDEEGLDYFLPTAIRSELPIVSIDRPSTRAILTHVGSVGTQPGETEPGKWVRWMSAATAKGVRQSLCEVLNDLPQARADAAHLRRYLLRHRPQSDTIQAYHDLIRRVMRKRAGNRVSIEAVS